MNFETQDQSKSIQKFFYEIHDITKLLSDISKRSLTNIEKEVMFHNKFIVLLNSASDFINDKMVSLELRSQTIFHVIPELNALINLLSEIGGMDYFWLELLSLLNELVIILTTVQTEGNIWNYQETSALLTRTLTQLPIFSSVPPFPKEGNIEFIDLWKITVKAICTTATVYVHGIEVIDCISIKDLTNWATLAFNNFTLLFEIFDQTDIVSMLKQTKDISNHIRDITNLVFTIDSVQKLALLLQSRFGNEWPDSLVSGPIISTHSIDGIIVLYEKLQRLLKTTLDIVMSIIAEGKLAIHENPNHLPYTVRLVNQIKIYEYSISYLKVLKALTPTATGIKDRKLVKSLVDEFFNLSNWYLKYLEQVCGDKDSILQSNTAKTCVNVMKNRLEILFLIAKWEKSLQIFEEEIKPIAWFIDKEEYNLFPDFYFLYYITKLTTYTYLSAGFDIDELFQAILKVRERLINIPRDYIACSVLLALLSFVTDKPLKTILGYLEEAKQKGIIEGNQHHLTNKFDKYVQDLRTVFLSKTSEDLFGFSIDNVNELDFATWMIPPLQKLKPALSTNLYLYVPFNRAVDSINDYH